MSRLKEKAFWIVSGDIAGRGLAFATSVYLARTLGSEFYGLIVVAISVLGYATWFADLGLIKIGTRETAKEPSKRKFRILEIFQLKIILGIIVLLGCSGIVLMINMATTEKHVILGYLCSLIPYMALLEWFYSGKQQFGKIALSKVLNGAIFFSLSLLLIKEKTDVTLVPILYTTGVSTACLTLGTLAVGDKPFTQPSRGIQIFPDLLKTSSILGLGAFFARVVQLLPPLLIGALLSMQEAGVYGAAFRIVIIAMMLDRVFINILLPNLSALWSIDKANAVEKVDTVYRLICIGGPLAGLMAAVGSEQVIGILYGSEYTESAALLKVLSVFISVTFVNSLFSFGLIATGKDREYFLATSIGGTFSALIIFASVAMGTAIHVAAAVSVSEIILAVLTYSWFRKTVNISYLKPVSMGFAIAILVYLLSIPLPLPGLLEAAILGFLYLVVMLNSGILSPGQRQWVKEKLM